MTTATNLPDEARLALLRRAAELKPDSVEVLLRLAYALAERGERDEFARLFQRAFRIRPTMVLPSLASAPEAGRIQAAEKLRANAQALLDRGVTYPPVLAALAISEAVLGNSAAVERIMDCDRFLRCIPSVVPPEFSGGGFFETLAAEIRTGLKYHDPQQGGVMRKAWRNDDVLNSGLPAGSALLREFHRQVEAYIAGLPTGREHPFLRARPEDQVMDGWAIVTSGEGHLAPHIHLRAWLNGVYYVRRPDAPRAADDQGGALKIGPPGDLGLTPADGWPERVIQPEPGTLVLMPGHFFHSTQPTHVAEERMCVAFNVYPAEFAHMANEGQA